MQTRSTTRTTLLLLLLLLLGSPRVLVVVGVLDDLEEEAGGRGVEVLRELPQSAPQRSTEGRSRLCVDDSWMVHAWFMTEVWGTESWWVYEGDEMRDGVR